jgi:hypothetical protein
MKITIIDERQGNCMTDEIAARLVEADIRLVIDPDNTVRVQNRKGETVCNVASCEYIVLPHRDQISGEISAAAYEKLISEREERERAIGVQDPIKMMLRAWEGPSYSGTAHITGAE